MKKTEFIKDFADKSLLSTVTNECADEKLTLSNVTLDELKEMIDEIRCRSNPNCHVLDGYFSCGGLSEIIVRK